MNTEPLFQHNAYLKECDAQLLECRAEGIVLDRTIFYPLGGGQPGDSGYLRRADGRSVRILDTRKGEAGRIVHVPESGSHGLEAGDAVHAQIDWERRYAVNSQWITDEELARQPELVRTMSVRPPAGVGRIRLLEIPGVDLQPCGGTHVARTGEIGPMQVAKVENKGRHNKRVYVSFA